MLDELLTLPALAGLTIILGFDNILAIAVVNRGVAPERRNRARQTGILIGLVGRLLLVLILAWGLRVADLRVGLGQHTLRDGLLVLIGLFLALKSSSELRDRTRKRDSIESPAVVPVSFHQAVLRILAVDLALSLDSVVTVVGMAPSIPIMVAAIVLEVAVILFFSGAVCRLLERYPSIETLAICALLMVGGVLVSEGVGLPIRKSVVYKMMAFALFVEVVNLRIEAARGSRTPGRRSRAANLEQTRQQ